MACCEKGECGLDQCITIREANKRIKELEERAVQKESQDIWRGEQEDAIRVLKAAGLRLPVPEAIEKLIAKVAELEVLVELHCVKRVEAEAKYMAYARRIAELEAN